MVGFDGFEALLDEESPRTYVDPSLSELMTEGGRILVNEGLLLLRLLSL